MQSQLRVEVRSEGWGVLVAVSGELDLASVPELERALDELSDSSTEVLVIDLRELDFMDSTGLSMIVRTHQQFADRGRMFGLVKGPRQVQRLLDLTGVAERIPLVDAPDEMLHGS